MEEAIDPDGIPLPESHTWDISFLVFVSVLQYTRLLVPLAGVAGAGVVGVVLLVAALLYSRCLLTAMGFSFMIIPVFISEIWAERKRIRENFCNETGSAYLSLLTHAMTLPGLVRAVDGNRRRRPMWVYALALLSMPEILGIYCLGLWVLVAFTPEFLTLGGAWPFADMFWWSLMQLDIIWEGRKAWMVWQTAAVVTMGCFGWSFVGGWCERRDELYMVRAVRRNEFPRALLPLTSDTEEQAQQKACQMGRVADTVLRSRYPSLWERIGVPRPALYEILYLTGLVYGVLMVLASQVKDWPQPPRTYWMDVLAAAAWSSSAALAIWSSTPLVVVLGFAIIIGVGLFTRYKQKIWRDRFHQVRFELRVNLPDNVRADVLENRARSATEAHYGPPPPGFVERVISLVFMAFRIALGLFWGWTLVMWVRHPGYLPAYVLPSFGSTSGAVAMASSSSSSAPGVCSDPSGVCSDSGLGALAALSGWAAEMRTAARVNLLAVRAWRRAGVEGVQVAMEALRATHIVNTALDTEGFFEDPNALWMVREARKALNALVGVQVWGLQGVEWEAGGRWCLGQGWEPLPPRVYLGGGGSGRARGAGKAGRGRGRVQSGFEGDDKDSRYPSKRTHAKPKSTRPGGGATKTRTPDCAMPERGYDENVFAEAWELRCSLEQAATQGRWDQPSDPGWAHGNSYVEESCGFEAAEPPPPQPQCSSHSGSDAQKAARERRASSKAPGGGEGYTTQPSAAPTPAPDEPWSWETFPWYTLANLVLAMGLVWWLVTAAPDWLRSPEKFVDMLASSLLRDGGASKKKAETQQSAGSRKKPPPVETVKGGGGGKGRQQKQTRQQQVERSGLASPSTSLSFKPPAPAQQSAGNGSVAGQEGAAAAAGTGKASTSTGSKTVAGANEASHAAKRGTEVSSKAASKKQKKQHDATSSRSSAAQLPSAATPAAAPSQRKAAAAPPPAAAAGPPSPAAAAPPLPPKPAHQMTAAERAAATVAALLPFTSTLASKALDSPSSPSATSSASAAASKGADPYRASLTATYPQSPPHPASVAAANAAAPAQPCVSAAPPGSEHQQPWEPAAWAPAGWEPALTPPVAAKGSHTHPQPQLQPQPQPQPHPQPQPLAKGFAPTAPLQSNPWGTGSRRPPAATPAPAPPPKPPAAAAHGTTPTWTSWMQPMNQAPRTVAALAPAPPPPLFPTSTTTSTTPPAASASATATPAAAAAARPAQPLDDEIPVPIPVPVNGIRSFFPAFAGAPQPPVPRPQPAPAPTTAPVAVPVQPSTYGISPVLGLNPALAHYVTRLSSSSSAPAPSARLANPPVPTAAAGAAGAVPAAANNFAAGAAAMGAPAAAEPVTGAGGDPLTALCITCKAAPRSVCYVHGVTSHMCYCSACGAGAKDGDLCPACGNVSTRVWRLALPRG